MVQKQSSTNTPAIKICNGKEYRYTMSIKDPTTTQLFLDKRFHAENSITFLNNECISR